MSDKEVLDMIKTHKTGRQIRETDVTTEIMELFDEEFSKNNNSN